MALDIPFGRYRLVRRLGRGGMAEVFLASQQGPAGFVRPVALKRMLPHLSEDPSFVARFFEEARIAAMLTHPNIVHVYDFGEVEGAYYLAMEYVDGAPLTRFIGKPADRIPLKHALKVASYICEGLGYAHGVTDQGEQLHLVHRDVSPMNVMVSRDGIVKLVDFGIAKIRTTNIHTQIGFIRANTAYLSPEQARGKPLDRRSDIYNLGIVLHELATGQYLFRGRSLDDVLLTMARVPPPSRLDPELPAEVDRVVARAMAADPKDRYPDALSMRDDLEALLRATGQTSDNLALAPVVAALLGPPEGSGLAPAAPDATRPIDNPPDAPARSAPAATGELPGAGTAARIARASTEPATALSPDPETPDSTAETSELPAGAPVAPRPRPDEDERVTEEVTALSSPAAPAFDPDGPTVSASRPDWAVARAAPLRPAPTGSRGLVLLPLLALAALALVSGAGLGAWLLLRAAPPEPGQPAGASPSRPALARVESEPPGAEILVDGRATGRTSPAAIELEPGRSHRLELRLEGHESAELEVLAGPGAVRDLSLALRPLPVELLRPELPPPPPELPPPPPELPPPPSEPAAVEVTTQPPGAIVILDGRAAEGRTPLTVEGLEPGDHRLAVEAEGCARDERELTLSAGERRVLELALRCKRAPATVQYGELSVTSVPWSWAYVGRRKLGQTPLAHVRLPAGRHTLKLVHPGRPELRHQVTIRPGEVTKVRLTL